MRNISLSTRLWLAWQVLRGRAVRAEWFSKDGETTIVFRGNEVHNRTWGEL